MLRADVRVGRREPRLILIDIRRLPGICQLLRRATCFGEQRIPACTREVPAPNEAVELTGCPEYSSVTAPLSFAVIMFYTAFEMLGQSYRVSAPAHAAAEL